MAEKTEAKKEELIVTRIIDAPVEIVWQAWTEPEHVMHWWGPKDYSSPSAKIDLRVGGQYVFAMQAPKEQGWQVSYTSGVYQRIVPMQVLEFTQGLSDADGNRIDPSQIGMPADFPKELHTVVAFRARGDMTELTITQTGWVPSQMFVYALAGTQQQTDKLSAYVQRTR
jgi:uncharacterized protein YndB with AHSA1/START domain